MMNFAEEIFGGNLEVKKLFVNEMKSERLRLKLTPADLDQVLRKGVLRTRRTIFRIKVNKLLIEAAKDLGLLNIGLDLETVLKKEEVRQEVIRGYNFWEMRSVIAHYHPFHPLVADVEENPELFNRYLEQALVGLGLSCDMSLNFYGREVQDKIRIYLQDQASLEKALEAMHDYNKRNEVEIHVSSYDIAGFEKAVKNLSANEGEYKDSYAAQDEVVGAIKTLVKEGHPNMIPPAEWASMHIFSQILQNLN